MIPDRIFLDKDLLEIPVLEIKYDGDIEYIRKDALLEQPDVDLEKEIDEYYHENLGFIISPIDTRIIVEHIARHFYELGLSAKKEK